MADPTLQTFCCHHANKSDIALVIMQEFNKNAYNIVCMVSSMIGMIGAIYQVNLSRLVSQIFSLLPARLERVNRIASPSRPFQIAIAIARTIFVFFEMYLVSLKWVVDLFTSIARSARSFVFPPFFLPPIFESRIRFVSSVETVKKCS